MRSNYVERAIDIALAVTGIVALGVVVAAVMQIIG